MRRLPAAEQLSLGRKTPSSLPSAETSFSRCRALKNGVELDIPNSSLYEDEHGLRSVDITDTRLGVEEGETLSVLREFSDRILVKNDRAEAGFWFK